MTTKTIIIGASNIFELSELILDPLVYEIMGYIGPQANHHSLFPTYSYLGTDAVIDAPDWADAAFVLALSKNKRRGELFDRLNQSGRKVISLLHPSAVVYPSATIGVGAIILPKAIISTHAELGNSVFVNYGALVGHDVTVGSFSFIAPGARVLGEAYIGSGSVIGANSVIHPQVRIGKNVRIAANTVITKDVPDNVSVIHQQKLRMIDL